MHGDRTGARFSIPSAPILVQPAQLLLAVGADLDAGGGVGAPRGHNVAASSSASTHRSGAAARSDVRTSRVQRGQRIVG